MAYSGGISFANMGGGGWSDMFSLLHDIPTIAALNQGIDHYVCLGHPVFICLGVLHKLVIGHCRTRFGLGTMPTKTIADRISSLEHLTKITLANLAQGVNQKYRYR